MTPGKLRGAAGLEYARRERGRGRTLTAIGRDLGVDSSTVSRWLSGERPPGRRYRRFCECGGGMRFPEARRKWICVECGSTLSRHKARSDYVPFEPQGRRRTMRSGQLKYLYGITLEDYETMLVEQGGVCAIRCNTGIGKFGEDPDSLRAAAAYLDQHDQKEHE